MTIIYLGIFMNFNASALPGSPIMRLRRPFFGNSTQNTPVELIVQVPDEADRYYTAFDTAVRRVE